MRLRRLEDASVGVVHSLRLEATGAQHLEHLTELSLLTEEDGEGIQYAFALTLTRDICCLNLHSACGWLDRRQLESRLQERGKSLIRGLAACGVYAKETDWAPLPAAKYHLLVNRAFDRYLERDTEAIDTKRLCACLAEHPDSGIVAVFMRGAWREEEKLHFAQGIEMQPLLQASVALWGSGAGKIAALIGEWSGGWLRDTSLDVPAQIVHNAIKYDPGYLLRLAGMQSGGQIRLMHSTLLEALGCRVESRELVLSEAELFAIGVERQEQLIAEWGMDEEEMRMVLTAVIKLRGTGLIEESAQDESMQHVLLLDAMAGFGAMYERMCRRCYEATVYAPYVFYTTGMPLEAECKPQLSAYDRGSAEEMALLLSRAVTVCGAQMSYGWWMSLLSGMKKARRLRNHFIHASGTEGFSVDAADEFFDIVLGKGRLLRNLCKLKCAKAEFRAR